MVSKKICFGILVIALIFVLMVGCENDSANDNGNSGGDGSSALSGTYTENVWGTTITFSGSNFTMKAFGSEVVKGTYTVSGSTLNLHATWVHPEIDDGNRDEVWQIIDANTIKDIGTGEIYRK